MVSFSITANRVYHPFSKEEAKGSKLKAAVAGGLDRLYVPASIASTLPSLRIAGDSRVKPQKDVRIAVLGASGYTGSKIVRLLANHPNFGITVMTADRKAGQSVGTVFPHLSTQDLPNMVAIADADFSEVDAVFCCLPHGTTEDIIKGLPKSLKIVDLSADF
ncbi:hypothetical protein MLD38_026992 [Melastoma candidum]|uniref:Uncharacterized protein n=1 Tax=Melastoma candidum TaxID=119954 RepID=A0ACB9P0B0_9MYRT|nr:hypothetical protein MLD38_026992 [Melastoma candidum]